MAMEKAGYSLQYLDPNGVIDPAADGTGVLYPDGPRYRAIVIDERALPAAVAEQLADEAAQGLAVVLVGELPTEDTSYRGDDARVPAAVARLLAQPRSRAWRPGRRGGRARAARRRPGGEVVGTHAALHAASRDRRRGLLLRLQRDQRRGEARRLVRRHRPPLHAEPVDGRGRPASPRGRRPAGARRCRCDCPRSAPTVLAFRKGESDGAPSVTSTSPVRETVARPSKGVELRDMTGGVREVRFSDGTTQHGHAAGAAGAGHGRRRGTCTWTAPRPSGTTPNDVDAGRAQGLAARSRSSRRVSGNGTYTTTVQLPRGLDGARPRHLPGPRPRGRAPSRCS